MRGLQNSKAHKRCDKNGDNFCQIGAQKELNAFTNIVINATAFLARGNNGGKVVVSKHHVRNTFGYISSGNAHTDAYISTFDGRRIINSIACHGGNHTFFAPHIHNAYLVLGLYACIYPKRFYLLFKVFVRDFIQLSPRNSLVAIVNNAQLSCNGNGGINVIAGNHNNTHAGTVSFFNSRLDFRTHGVNHAGKTYKRHVFFEI